MIAHFRRECYPHIPIEDIFGKRRPNCGIDLPFCGGPQELGPCRDHKNVSMHRSGPWIVERAHDIPSS